MELETGGDTQQGIKKLGSGIGEPIYFMTTEKLRKDSCGWELRLR